MRILCLIILLASIALEAVFAAGNAPASNDVCSVQIPVDWKQVSVEGEHFVYKHDRRAIWMDVICLRGNLSVHSQSKSKLKHKAPLPQLPSTLKTFHLPGKDRTLQVSFLTGDSSADELVSSTYRLMTGRDTQ